MEKKILNKKDLKLSLIFMILAAIGGFLTALYQVNNMSVELLGGMSPTQLIIIATIQTAVLYGFLLSFLGLKLSRAVNIRNGFLGNYYSGSKYNINFKSVATGIIFGFINAVVLVLGDKLIFSRLIPELAQLESQSTGGFNPLYLLSAITYGGIVEEVMLRLFFMSLMVFILYKVFTRKKTKDNIPNWIYWAGIIISALIFGIAHLPAAAVTFILTPISVTRIIVLNSFAGILFGYLYWKKGIEYSMISHMFSHIFMQLVLMPIFL